LKKLVLASALLASMVAASPAAADDPIIVVRPPSISLKAGVLPMNAFQAQNPGTTNPTTPSVPSDGYVFKSSFFDQTDNEFNVPVKTATTSLSGANGGHWDNPWLPNGFCDIKDSASGDTRKKNAVMYVPDMSGGSKQERYIEPYVTGKMAVVFICDAVNGSPTAPIYVGKVVLTVTP
jgi:hypothetical protein